MSYIIRVNGIDYLITDYAAMRMLQRYIIDDMIIQAILRGELIEQAHGRDILEVQFWDDDTQQTRIIRIIIAPDTHTVITVYDDSDTAEE
ncbi:MAG: DUF4258 domain-containing protein [Anaerolineaceae bacterium]|nr:DUF4258 domain-containing protein [Anaerolineaceae bacterium]